MEKYLGNYELIVLFIFVFTGFIIASIYDFFRACRKYKKRSTLEVVVQDICFCLICTIIITFNIVYFLKEQVRLYIIVSSILGGIIYFSTISTFVLKIYIKTLETSDKILTFIFAPFILYFKILHIMYAKVEKNVVKCCNVIKNVIFLKCKFTKKDTRLWLKKKKM